MNSENNTNDTNISPYAAVKEVLKICFLHRSEAGWTWSAPVLSVALAMLSELLSFLVMKIISDFYLSITSFDEHLFASTAERAIIVVISISLVKSSQTYFSDLSALLWRDKIVSYLHKSYTSYLSKRCAGPKMSALFECNVEQRISQDVDKLTNELSRVFEKAFVCPVLICFYSYYLYSLLGGFAPVSCFIYFLVGALISTTLSKKLIDIVIAQEYFEGVFRRYHSHFLNNLWNIKLLGGIRNETSTLHKSFVQVVKNTRHLVAARLQVNIFLNFYSYLGSIVSYFIVGCFIFYWKTDDHGYSESEMASFVAQGTYASLYLISAFSTILSLSEAISDIVGLSVRVTKLLYIFDFSSEDLNTNCWNSSCGLQRFFVLFGIGKTSPKPSFSAIKSVLLGKVNHSYEECSLGEYEVPYSALPNTSIDDSIFSPNRQQIRPKSHFLLRIPNLTFGDSIKCDDFGSFKLSEGDRLLISGPSGCGKSTLLKHFVNDLSNGTSDPENHLMNQKCCTSIVFSIIHQLFIFVPQMPYCFQGSLLQNILYPTSVEEVLEHVLKAAQVNHGIHELIEKTRHELNDSVSNLLSQCGLSPSLIVQQNSHDETKINIRGYIFSEPSANWPSILSYGQQQLLGIARGIFKRPILMIIDDVLSSLDDEKESEMLNLIMSSSISTILVGRPKSKFASFSTKCLTFEQSKRSFILRGEMAAE